MFLIRFWVISPKINFFLNFSQHLLTKLSTCSPSKNTVFGYKNTSKVNGAFNMALIMHLGFEKRSLTPNPSIVHGDFDLIDFNDFY